ncbi:MAG TPA: Rv3235 family protein [Streptosporangiaceae bacterium]
MTTPRPELPGQPSSRPARPDQHQPGPRDPSLPAAQLAGPGPRGPALPRPDLPGPGLPDPGLRDPGLHDPGLHDPGLHDPGLHPARLPVLPPFPRQPGWLRPLPDVVAVQRMPLPDSAPPYDDDQRASVAPGGPRAASTEPGSADPGCAEPAIREVGQPGPPGLAGMPGAWPSQFAQALAEALAGARPAQQLTSWTTQRARSRIRRLGPVLQSGPRPRVLRVLGSAPTSDVVELTIILSVGPAVRALAVRLERAGPDALTRMPRGEPDPGRHASGRLPGRPGSAADDARGAGPAWLCTDIEAA